MQEDEANGQEVSEIFHKGDLFIDCSRSASVEASMRRFVRAFFGHNGISPRKNEYGMYAASGAALRSIDLSRQVGAAIFTQDGEAITHGCNEVPKAFGGTYWEGEAYEPHRDFEEGLDANQSKKSEILRDILHRLAAKGMLLKKYRPGVRTADKAIDELLNGEIFKLKSWT